MHFDKEASEAMELMRALGVPLPATILYISILQQGATSERQISAITSLPHEAIRDALQYLNLFLLVSQDVVSDETTFYASDPRNAWKAHDTQFYWMKSIHIGDIDKLPPLPEMADELRRRKYSRLERLCGGIYERSAKAYDPLRHRHRDIGSAQLFASWLGQTIASAKKSIVAVERPPRLPELAPIWVALTRRIRAGVSYTRIVSVNEVVEHGLDVVDRDMEEYGIDLRLMPDVGISDAFYIVDGKRLLLKNTRGDSRSGRSPHFGVYTSQHQIVRRYLDRFQSSYLPASLSARDTVADLRIHADDLHAKLIAKGRREEAAVFMDVVRFGKFASMRLPSSALAAWLVDAGHLVVNQMGHLVMVTPTSR